MRKIKFRGKVMWNGNHKFSGDWVYGYYRNNDNGNAFITETVDDFDNYIFDEIEIDENTVGQFTGLKDKNGKEIYEGDILKIDKEDYKYIVKFYSGCFVTVNKYDEHYEQAKALGSLFTLEIEIIGNIYDNPELLEEE